MLMGSPLLILVRGAEATGRSPRNLRPPWTLGRWIPGPTRQSPKVKPPHSGMQSPCVGEREKPTDSRGLFAHASRWPCSSMS